METSIYHFYIIFYHWFTTLRDPLFVDFLSHCPCQGFGSLRSDSTMDVQGTQEQRMPKACGRSGFHQRLGLNGGLYDFILFY